MPKKGLVKMDIKKLLSLAEGLKHTPDIQVGVFSGKTDRKSGDMTNADLARIHELGSPEHGIPARSMLRTPIADHAQQIMESVKGHSEGWLKESGPMKIWKMVGIAAEKIVLQAFATGGFGKWPALKYATLLAKLNRGKKGKSLARRKGIIAQIYSGEVGMGILIDTGQLRRSFSSRVRMKL